MKQLDQKVDFILKWGEKKETKKGRARPSHFVIPLLPNTIKPWKQVKVHKPKLMAEVTAAPCSTKCQTSVKPSVVRELSWLNHGGGFAPPPHSASKELSLDLPPPGLPRPYVFGC
jgi:hypothetical protein